MYIYNNVSHFFLEREIFRVKVVEDVKAKKFCSITFFSENRAFYEIVWRNIVESDRPI